MDCFRLKDINIKDYLGNKVNLLFVARGIICRPQKNNGEFMILTMADRDKMVEAKIFGITEETKSKIVEGLVYEATVSVQNYQKSPDKPPELSCVIANDAIFPSAVHPSQLADWAENLQDYSNFIGEALKLTDGTVYGEVTRAILTKYWDKFVRWPAASSQHHTRLGDLLFHTATVVEDTLAIANIYKRLYGQVFINVPLMVSGAILHDIMKTRELNADINSGATDYSNTAALSTHVMDILTEIDIYAAAKDIVYTEEIQLLKHVVAAHHGKLEYGSPIKGSCPEAIIVSTMDELDAEMWRYNREFKDLAPGDHTATWQNGSSLIVRYKESSKKDPIVL